MISPPHPTRPAPHSHRLQGLIPVLFGGGVRGLGGAAPGRSGGGWARGRVQWKFHELFRGWGPVYPPPGRPNPANSERSRQTGSSRLRQKPDRRGGSAASPGGRRGAAASPRGAPEAMAAFDAAAGFKQDFERFLDRAVRPRRRRPAAGPSLPLFPRGGGRARGERWRARPLLATPSPLGERWGLRPAGARNLNS